MSRPFQRKSQGLVPSGAKDFFFLVLDLGHVKFREVSYSLHALELGRGWHFLKFITFIY
jgi:hypothetical protein